ncbi:MAG: hypothetical protein ACRERU_14420 [Methylococcales bacterium]
MCKSKQIILVLGLLIASWSDPAASRSPESNCDEGLVPGHAVTFFMDFTDPVGEAARMEAEHTLHRYRDELEQGDRLTVFALHAPAENQDAVLAPIFSACKPQPPSTANRWIQNPAKIKERYKVTWHEPLTGIAAVLAQNDSAKAATSPLLMKLKEISIAREFQAQQRTLVLYSDLLEHTPLFSMYDTQPDFAALQAKGFAPLDVEGLFRNTEVRITRLANPEHRKQQTPVIERFWVDYFTAAGVGATGIVLNNLDRQGPGGELSHGDKDPSNRHPPRQASR